MGIPEISAALSSIKTVIEAAKGYNDLSSDIKIKQINVDLTNQLLSLQGTILDIREKYDELSEIKNELQKKLSEYEDWNTQAADYKLFEAGPQVYVYSYQPQSQTGQPPHWLCAKCFIDRNKSFLTKPDPRAALYACSRCGYKAFLKSTPGGE